MDVLSSRTIIRPSDLDASIAFYRDRLGLPVAREFGAGAGRGIVFFAGGGMIEVVGGDGTPTHPAGVSLWLQVRDIRASLDDLSGRGVEAVRPARLEPWGLIEAWIDDPDGLRIHIVEVPPDHPLRRDQRDVTRGPG